MIGIRLRLTSMFEVLRVTEINLNDFNIIVYLQFMCICSIQINIYWEIYVDVVVKARWSNASKI